MSTEITKVTDENRDWLAYAEALVVIDDTGKAMMNVTDDMSYTLAAEARKVAKAFIRKAEERWNPIKTKAKEAHQATVDAEREDMRPFKRIVQLCDDGCRPYLRKLEEARQAEQRRLEAEARKREEDQRLAEAAALEEEGLTEEAEAVLNEEPVSLPVPVVQSAAPKVQGHSTRKTYKAKVTNPMSLIQHIANHPELGYLVKTFDQAALNQMARSQKQSFDLPGCELVEETGFAS